MKLYFDQTSPSGGREPFMGSMHGFTGGELNQTLPTKGTRWPPFLTELDASTWSTRVTPEQFLDVGQLGFQRNPKFIPPNSDTLNLQGHENILN